MRACLTKCLMTAAILAITVSTAQAQSALIQRLDVNKDGKVSREEIPEGASRRFFDNMVEKYKLDPAKTYTLQELEQAAGLGGNSSSSSGGTNSPGRFTGSRRGPSRNGPPSPSTSTRAPSDGRPYRALEQLPDPYRTYDRDGDGQIGLYEWPRDRIPEFLGLDKNDDGFITINEVKRPSAPSAENE